MSEVKKKTFNPNLGGAFTNDKFGEGSIILNITEENYDVIQKNLRVGSAILLKYNKVTTKGNKHYFSEILPPMSRDNTTGQRVKAAAGDLD